MGEFHSKVIEGETQAVGWTTTVYSVGEALRMKPDCAVCGHPYSRHNIGALTTCPIIATYKPLSQAPR